MSQTPLSFLGGVDSSSGVIRDPDCPERGSSVGGKVLCFPYGRGSTVGSYSMYQLKLNGVAPEAILNVSAEPIVATGAIISGIPMVDRIDISLIKSGDHLLVDGDEGTVDIRGVTERHVVTTVLRNGGAFLVLRRSSRVGSFRGKWACVSGFIEAGETDVDAAKREIVEETGIRGPELARALPVERFRDGRSVWTVHPFLFDVPTRSVRIDWEHDESRWVTLDELPAYDCVPGLRSVVTKLLSPEC